MWKHALDISQEVLQFCPSLLLDRIILKQCLQFIIMAERDLQAAAAASWRASAASSSLQKTSKFNSFPRIVNLARFLTSKLQQQQQTLHGQSVSQSSGSESDRVAAVGKVVRPYNIISIEERVQTAASQSFRPSTTMVGGGGCGRVAWQSDNNIIMEPVCQSDYRTSSASESVFHARLTKQVMVIVPPVV